MAKTKKQVILETAARMFRDQGYAATSMRHLAHALGLTASSLYNHVTGKGDILRGICFQNAERFAQGMAEVEARPGSSIEKVSALIRLHITIAAEDPTAITAFNDEWRHLEEPHLTAFKNMRRDYERRFRRILETGMERGEVRQMDAGVAFSSLVSATRWVYDWYALKRTGKDLEQLVQDITRLLLGGLQPTTKP